MPLVFYLADIFMLVLALAAMAVAVRQSRGQIVPRWQLLPPGVLATLATVALLIYPHPRDLLDLGMWLAGSLGLLVGAARGAFMGMESDHNWRLVRLRYGKDELWGAIALAAFAALNFAVEMISRDVNPYMTSVVLLMTLSGSYLMGRSLVGWSRAGSIAHDAGRSGPVDHCSSQDFPREWETDNARPCGFWAILPRICATPSGSSH